jgi:hypothetical protein
MVGRAARLTVPSSFMASAETFAVSGTCLTSTMELYIIDELVLFDACVLAANGALKRLKFYGHADGLSLTKRKQNPVIKATKPINRTTSSNGVSEGILEESTTSDPTIKIAPAMAFMDFLPFVVKVRRIVPFSRYSG